MYNIKPDKFISGTTICDNCHTQINWRYRIHPKECGLYIGTYTDNDIFAYKQNVHDDNDNTYCVRCRKCDKINIFTLE